MKITLLCSDTHHPVNAYLKCWIKNQADTHEVELIQKRDQLTGGDILFLISCSEVIKDSDRGKYSTCLVLHASDLPKGRGWSPHVWELIQGAEYITLSLLEAEDKVDSGKIWQKKKILIPNHALWYEINHLLFQGEIDLIDFAVKNLHHIEPKPQTKADEGTCYPRRIPRDSRIDINQSIKDQFNLMRVCDPDRFPAYFEYLGHKYILRLEKSHEK